MIKDTLLMRVNPFVFIGLAQNKYNFKNNNKIDIDSIINLVCDVLNLERDDVMSNSRKRDLVEARTIAIGLINTIHRITLKKLGSIFGKDHSTIIYTLKNFNELKEYDRQFKDKLDLVMKYIPAICDDVVGISKKI